MWALTIPFTPSLPLPSSFKSKPFLKDQIKMLLSSYHCVIGFVCFVEHKEAEGVGESTPHARCGRKCPWKGTHASRAHQHQGFVFLLVWSVSSFNCWFFVGVAIMGFERLVYFVSFWWFSWMAVKLIETGEKERLMELLRERLVDCGWKDEMKALCRYFFYLFSK